MPEGHPPAPLPRIFDGSALGREFHDERWELVTRNERQPMRVSAVPLGDDGNASVVVFQFAWDSRS